MNKLFMSGGMSRRTFLQVSAAGVVTATALGARAAAPAPSPMRSSPGSRRAARSKCSTTIRTGSAKKMGYFADLGIETDMQPGPSDGTATVKFVDVGQADMGFPSPGVFSFALAERHEAEVGLPHGRLDTFSLAFRKGEGTNDLKKLEGKTILLGSAAWQSIVDPMLAVQGVDITQGQICRSRLADLGARRSQAGQGDAALSWEGLRAEWIGTGLDFEYWLGVQQLAAVCQHLRRPRRRPR